MTEPDVASSDATNIQLRIERDGDDYVLNGRKWWTTERHAPALPDHDRDGQDPAPTAPIHKQQSQILVPIDTPGVTIVREPAGVRLRATRTATAKSTSTTCACPPRNLIAGEGDGFMIAQARLGPGRHPPLHARDRRGRAGAGGDVQARRLARHLRAADRDARQRPGLDRRVAHRDRDGAPADAEGGVDDGHGRQPPRAHRDLRDQGRRAERRAEGARPRDPGARRRRRLRRTSASPPPTRTCARCASPTVPTRSTSSRSPAASSRPTCPARLEAGTAPTGSPTVDLSSSRTNRVSTRCPGSCACARPGSRGAREEARRVMTRHARLVLQMMLCCAVALCVAPAAQASFGVTKENFEAGTCEARACKYSKLSR